MQSKTDLYRWYNATYILFAVSILLAVIFRQLAETRQALEKVYTDIDKAIAILQAMDDCVVTRNAITIIKSTLARARKVNQSALAAPWSPPSRAGNASNKTRLQNGAETTLHNIQAPQQPSMPFGEPLNSDFGECDWLGEFSIDANQQPSFWTEWALELDMLGT